jgi:hypothetical protein
MTVVVPVSPIVSHPDTSILEETLDSVRHHLPDVEILLTFDGVRPEHEHRRGDYEKFIRRVLWRADHHYGNIAPFVFDEHRHQSGMLRAVLDEVETPLLTYVEQDTPLVADEPIDFDSIGAFVLGGGSNLVRLHHEAVIPREHEHMMHGHIRHIVSNDAGSAETEFILTSQWSQRPHVASTAFYRRIMADYFTPDARAFIEERMHGVVDNAFRRDGIHGWEQYRLHIYNPGANLKRSYHVDGRQGEPRYDEQQVF